MLTVSELTGKNEASSILSPRCQIAAAESSEEPAEREVAKAKPSLH
jgi:hypothetical protein